MSESRLFQRLKRATPGFHWQRHEDKLTSGIPDCDYGACGVGGWVELKTYDSWPRNESEPLKWTDLKPTQVNWCIKRYKSNPRVWFLVQVKDDWFLIRGCHARKFGKLTKAELLELSDIHGTNAISRKIAKVFTS